MYRVNPYVTRMQITPDSELWYNPLNQRILILNHKDLSDVNSGKPGRKLVEHAFVIKCKADETDPEILTRIWDSVVKSYSFEPKIEVAYFILTEQCNLACKYCFVKRGTIGHGSAEASRMPVDVMDRGLELFSLFAKNAKEPVINLYGGEPLLNDRGFAHLLERVESMKSDGTMPSRTATTLVTNGLALNDAIISLIKKHRVALSISLDGPPELNDKMRVYPDGTGSSTAVIKNIKSLSRIGVWFTISCSITKYNLSRLDEAVKYFMEELGCREISLNMPMITDEFKPDPSRMAENMLRAYETIKSNGGSEDRFSRILRPLIEGGIKVSDCAGCGGQIVVSPNGLIGPCHAYLGYKDGHFIDFGLLNDDPRTVKKRIERSELFGAWARKSPLLNHACDSCKVFSLCGGGCYHFAETHGLEKDENWCAYVKAASAWALKRISAEEKDDLRAEAEKVFRAKRPDGMSIPRSLRRKQRNRSAS